MLATGIFSYRIGKNKNRNTRDDNKDKSLRDLNLKIKLLEEKNESLEKIISKNLKSQQQTSANISSKKDEIKEKSPEEVKLEEERNRDMAYDDALENPNLINEFVKMYGVIGLDKGSKVARGENAILKRDDKPIERCNFWGMPNPNDPSGNKWIIFPGRTLQSNAAALTADDSRYGREILSGIFNFEVGTTFRVITFAQANKDQDGFKIIGQGQLVLPK